MSEVTTCILRQNAFANSDFRFSIVIRNNLKVFSINQRCLLISLYLVVHTEFPCKHRQKVGLTSGTIVRRSKFYVFPSEAWCYTQFIPSWITVEQPINLSSVKTHQFINSHSFPTIGFTPSDTPAEKLQISRYWGSERQLRAGSRIHIPLVTFFKPSLTQTFTHLD